MIGVVNHPLNGAPLDKFVIEESGPMNIQPVLDFVVSLDCGGRRCGGPEDICHRIKVHVGRIHAATLSRQ